MSTITNSDLQRSVEDEFLWDPMVVPASIGVSVNSGAVTLSGTTPTYSDRLAAVAATKRVKGVIAIADDITVSSSKLEARSDTDIATHLETALKWNIQVPDAVRATVRDGVVTLDGNVDWHFQKAAAEHAVNHLHGVSYVVNKISLKSSVAPSAVHDHIAAALRRHADVDASAITVTSDGGKVTLTGTVASWADRDRAENAAWASPGVTNVHDSLHIR
jgi:osmotically-inducible protein OsmY